MADIVQDAGPAKSIPTIPFDAIEWGVEGCPVQPFVPFLDQTGLLGAEPRLHLLRAHDGPDAGYASVWVYEGDGVARELSSVFAWMWSRPDLWTAWGRAAVGLGPGYLNHVVARDLPDLGVMTETDGVEPRGRGHAGLPGLERPRLDVRPRAGDDDDDDDEAEDEATRQLWCGCGETGSGRYRKFELKMWHGRDSDQAFFRLRYDKASERDRVYDWMQHQTQRYREFAAYHEANGSDALKKLIYGGMLETERTVKKAGLGSGGTRPLRFWPGPSMEAGNG